MATCVITLQLYLWNINKGKLLDQEPVEIKVNPKMQLCQFLVNISRKTGIDKLDREISVSTLDSEKRIIMPSPYNLRRTFEFNGILDRATLAITLYSPLQKSYPIHPPQESLMIEVPPKSEIKPIKKVYQNNPTLDQIGAYFAQSVYLSAPDPSELPNPTGLFDD